jgi:long-chain acyl-CoA synthetase
MSERSEFYPEGVSNEIELPEDKTLINLFREAIDTFQDNIACESFGASMSFNQLDELSARFAAYLQHGTGIKSGDRVALMSPNCLPFVVAMWGILRAGAIQVNVNPLYTPPELKHQLLDADVDTIVIFSGSTSTLADIVAETGIKRIIVFGLDDLLDRELPSPPTDPRLTDYVPFMEALSEDNLFTLAPVTIAPKDGAFLQYTGGTTGLSKGALLTHANMVANIEQFLQYCGDRFTPGEEIILTAIPMYHIFALMVNAISFLSLGAVSVLVTNPRDMDGFVAQWKSSRPTVFAGVNTLYNGLLHHPDFASTDFSRLHFCVGGGAPVQAAVSSAWLEVTNNTIYEGYGLSETSPVVTLNLGKNGDFVPGIGLPLPGTDISLRDENLQPVEDGEAGELCVKGPQVMAGYWNDPEATAEVFTEDGYFMTGDIAIQDVDGFYHIVDRKKDMVLVSGFNVYPNEIEAVVAAMDGVMECACIGIPDEDTGEAVKLFVVKSDEHIDKQAIIEFCRPRLTAYKVPKQIEFMDELPKSTVGKILRRSLR